MQVSTQKTSSETYLRIRTAATDMSVLLESPTREAAWAEAQKIKDQAERMLERAALIETAALQLNAAN